jgi:hypothetical protein
MDTTSTAAGMEFDACEEPTQGETRRLKYFAAFRQSEELSPAQVLLIRRTVDANNRRGHAVVEDRAQPKRESGWLVYPGSRIEPEGHCLYSGDVAYEVPVTYGKWDDEGIAYFYLLYVLDKNDELWVSVNRSHTPMSEYYSWDAVIRGEMTLRAVTDDAGAKNVKDFIRRIHGEGQR